MKNIGICAGFTAIAIAFGAAGAALAASPGNAHILVIDRRELMTTSKLGENIRQQLMAYNQKLQSDFGPEGQALQTEEQALESSKIPADQHAKRQQALETRQAAFRQKVQDRQSLMQGGQIAARKYFTDQVDAIVRAIMAEHGADVVLDKSTIVASTNGSDITKEAIQRLDKKAPSFKVPLVKPSLQDQLQMQGMRQGGPGEQ